jgi:hypothetical protein
LTFQIKMVNIIHKGERRHTHIHIHTHTHIYTIE